MLEIYRAFEQLAPCDCGKSQRAVTVENDRITISCRGCGRRVITDEVRAVEDWEEELRYNPYHDPSNGRFTSGDGGGSALVVGKGLIGYYQSYRETLEKEDAALVMKALSTGNVSDIIAVKKRLESMDRSANSLGRSTRKAQQDVAIDAFRNEHPGEKVPLFKSFTYYESYASDKLRTKLNTARSKEFDAVKKRNSMENAFNDILRKHNMGEYGQTSMFDSRAYKDDTDSDSDDPV